jgi:TfoX/Sxy family transcriptional regulator of competence genes
MAYDEFLADRVRQTLAERGAAFAELKMMGGLCFMVDDKMCVGVMADQLMARIGPDAYAAALERPGCDEMRFTGRAMRGFVLVGGAGIDTESDLAYWIERCLAFNPLAKASKKHSRKKSD